MGWGNRPGRGNPSLLDTVPVPARAEAPETALTWLRANWKSLAAAAVLLAGLFFISRANYLLFHTLAELFSVVIAATIFVLTWNSRGFLNNGYLLVLGLSYLFVGGLDLLHALAYAGMGVFPGTDPGTPTGPNLATQLWLSARYVQAFTLVAAPFFAARGARSRPVLVVYLLVTALLLLSIFTWRVFPASFAGQITPFKRASEYVIIVLLLTGMVLLERIRARIDPDVRRLLVGSIILNALAELAFTEYLAINDLVNLFGHFMKIVAFWLIYKAMIEMVFIKPKALLFRDLQESEARAASRAAQLEALMDSVPALVRIAHDPQARSVTGNKAATQVFGPLPGLGDASPLLGVYDWSGRPVPPEEYPLQRAVTSGGPVRDIEEMIELPDGSQRYLYGNAVPLFDEQGHPNGAVAALIDMTERVQAQRALRESEARLRRLVDSNIIGIMYCSAEGPIWMANDAFLEMIGYTRADLEAGLVNWRKLTPPEHLSLDEAGLVEANQRGACTPYEKEYVRKDGRRVPILIGYAYLQEERDGSQPLICFILDQSEQKAAQATAHEYAERLALSNRNLERVVSELGRANRELERANRELQDFAFVASHDLQEPLRKIQAFGERLNERSQAGMDAESSDYLARMLNAARRMRAMIDDLLSLSRVTTRAQPFEKVDLKKVAAEVLSDLVVRIERAQADVEVAELPVIDADPVQMHQLLQNLIGNALKFQKPETTPVVRVSNHFSTDGRFVTITVEDNGIGFEEQYAERIFQPFQRLHGVGKYEGSGMGLAICRKIAERHAGMITAQGTPGEGARFAVTLPVKGESAARQRK